MAVPLCLLQKVMQSLGQQLLLGPLLPTTPRRCHLPSARAARAANSGSAAVDWATAVRQAWVEVMVREAAVAEEKEMETAASAVKAVVAS